MLACGLAKANPAHDRIAAMSEQDRAGVFAKLLEASGEKCKKVNRTFFQGTTKNGDAFWNAECQNGAAYLVSVSNNASGSTSIMSCAVLKKMNAETCFKKY
jgi:hypothetical protein